MLRQKYFRSLNGIFGKIGTRSSTAVRPTLSLISSFCVPMLTYGIEAFNVSLSMYNTIEAAYSAAFSKIFSTFDKNIIKQCQFYCSVSPLCNIIDVKRLHFLHGLSTSHNFSMRFLFDIKAKCELIELVKKHGLANANHPRWKHIIWNNFVHSL